MTAVVYKKALFVFLIIINIHKICYGIPARGIVFPSDDDESSREPSNLHSNNTGIQSRLGVPQPVPQKSNASQQEQQRNVQPMSVSNPQLFAVQELSNTNKQQKSASRNSTKNMPMSNSTTDGDDYDVDDVVDDNADKDYHVHFATRTILNCKCKISADRCARTDKC